MLLTWLGKWAAHRPLSRGDRPRRPSRCTPSRRRTANLEIETLEDRNPIAAIRPLAGFGTNILPQGGTVLAGGRTDDGSSPSIPIGFTINFFGIPDNTVFINNNGNVTLATPLAAFTPFGLTTNIGTPIFAPFFADVDTRNPLSGVVTYGTDNLCGLSVFGVNWINVGYFSQNVNFLNSFQLIIISREDTGPGNFDIEFNYDRIQWETGDASGGVNGRGGNSARIGYSNGTGAAGSFFELPGSGIPGSFLDGARTALTANSLLASTPGRYHFQVRNGQVLNFQDISDIVRVYYPFRYTFDAATQTYRGNLTVLNPGFGVTLEEKLDFVPAGTGFGPIALVFPRFTQGVRLVNPTGVTASGLPFITLPNSTLRVDQNLRVPIELSNPNQVNLTTFFQGFPVRVISGQFNPARF